MEGVYLLTPFAHAYNYGVDTSALGLSLRTLAGAGRRDHLVLQVSGELDLLTRGHLRNLGSELLRMCADGEASCSPFVAQATSAGATQTSTQRACIADLSEVTFIDCAGLAGLLQLLDEAVRQGYRVAVVAPHRRVLRVLLFLGIQQSILVSASLGLAWRGLEEAPRP